MVKQYFKDLKTEFKGYSGTKFGKDLFAGLTVTAVALPLALAFGVSSGADAAAGLVTAIIAGLIISLFSGASYQISGPTGAMTAILFTLVAKYQLQGVFIAGLMSGIILLICGVLKLGKLVYCIPKPVVTGFTSGIAIIIILGQFDNIFGIKAVGTNPFEKIVYYFQNGSAINLTTIIITLCVIVFMMIYPKKLNGYFPSSLAVIIVCVVLNTIFKFDVPTIGSIPKTIFLDNRLNLSSINIEMISNLIVPAISIAALGMVESLLCGASAGNLKGEKMNADRELVAQGIGNIIIPFFGGVPATAAIARTSVAIKSGGQTRLTGIIHAVGLILSMFLLGSVMSIIPLATLAGVLVVTAWRMNEWENIRYFFSKKFKGAISKFLITMVATVVFDLTIAIALGVLFSACLFIIKIAKIDVDTSEIDTDRLSEDDEIAFEKDKTVVVYITGPIFFLTSEKLEEIFEQHKEKSTVIFSMRGVPLIDTTGAAQFLKFCEEMKQDGKDVIFAGLQKNAETTLKRAGIADIIGEESFFWSVNQAIVK